MPVLCRRPPVPRGCTTSGPSTSRGSPAVELGSNPANVSGVLLGMTTTSTILRGALTAAALVATVAAVAVTSGPVQPGKAVDRLLEPASARATQPVIAAAGSKAAADAPANVVDWPSRGAAPAPGLMEKALSAFARAVGVKRHDVQGKLLFAGDDDSRNTYVFGQAWIKGSDAHTFGYSESSARAGTPFLGPVTGEDPPLLAFVLAPGTGQTRETLMVIPKPAVSEVFYGEAGSEYTEIEGQEYLDGVKLVDRRPGVQGDMLKLLLADGSKAFEDDVESLLCGTKECG